MNFYDYPAHKQAIIPQVSAIPPPLSVEDRLCARTRNGRFGATIVNV